jgi:hypothetical protein
MKKLPTIAGLALLAITALAGSRTPYTPQVDPNTTNTLIVDCRGLQNLSVMASGTGLTWYSTTLTITSNPNTNGTQVLSVLYNGTNNLYTWTNQAGPLNLVPGATTAASVTNLYSAVQPVFTSLNISQTASAVTFSSYGIPFVITNSAGWATLAAVTNTANGNLIVTATVSGDTVSWYSYPGLNLTLPLSSSPTVTGTNAALGGWPFVQFTIASVATNGACPTFKLVPSGD